jgi:hypothetical protein
MAKMTTTNPEPAPKLPTMSLEELVRRLQDGQKTFSNGKTKRHVIAFDGIFVYYKTKLNSGTTGGVIMDKFAKWCRVDGGE